MLNPVVFLALSALWFVKSNMCCVETFIDAQLNSMTHVKFGRL